MTRYKTTKKKCEDDNNFEYTKYIIDKHIKYSSSWFGSPKGICYQIGTNFGKTKYKNPEHKN